MNGWNKNYLDVGFQNIEYYDEIILGKQYLKLRQLFD